MPRSSFDAKPAKDNSPLAFAILLPCSKKRNAALPADQMMAATPVDLLGRKELYHGVIGYASSARSRTLPFRSVP